MTVQSEPLTAHCGQTSHIPTMTTTPNKLAICVFRIADVETDCDKCARVKQYHVPNTKEKQAWQYVPKVNEGENCPSFIGVEK